MNTMKLFAACVIFLLLLGGALPGRAMDSAPEMVSIQVNTPADELAVDGNCSLREAIIAANTNQPVDACPAGSGADVISLPVGVYNLAIAGTNEDAARTGDLDITEELTINGASAPGGTPDRPVIDAQQLDRVFHIVNPSRMQPFVVTLSHLTIQNGKISEANKNGGGIENEIGNLTLTKVILKGNIVNAYGGGLNNNSNAFATFTNCTLDGNQAASGGGINNQGHFDMYDSVLMNNSVSEKGGGLFNWGVAQLVNVTFSGNTASPINGGGIFNIGDLYLQNNTISGNSTAIYNGAATKIVNTILSGSTEVDNCRGSVMFIQSYGHNLESGSTCNLIHETDKRDTNPILGAISDNGGPAFTMAIVSQDSPAVDAGDPANCTPADARGANRVAGKGSGSAICDIGAFEYGAIPTTNFIYLPFIGKK